VEGHVPTLTWLNSKINTHWNESPQNWWIFVILPNTSGSKYFPHKCGGFLELTPTNTNDSQSEDLCAQGLGSSAVQQGARLLVVL
jgi:hypothetical protein